MKSDLFNRRGMVHKKGASVQEAFQQDIYWENEIREMMEQGHSYQVACSIVSRRKIKEFFEKDRKVDSGI